MARFELDVAESFDDFVTGTDPQPFVHTTTVPSGAKVIAGGFKVVNLDRDPDEPAAISPNGPTASGDGWTVGVTPYGWSTGDTIRVTVYATHVKVN